MIEMIEDLAGAAAALVFDSQEHSHDEQQQQAYVLKTSKRRKCAAETRVISVPDGNAAAADTWAWRKYGQKPIKGSPYPRSYYRCSSSKGCSARKQVERSKNNPSMLVVTYTSDHNHPQPHPNSTKKHHNHVHNHSNHHHIHQEQKQHQEEEASEVAETALTTNSNTPAAEMSPAPVMDAPVLPPSPPSTSSPTLLFTQHDNFMCTTNIDIDVGDEDLFADLDELPEWSAFFLRTSAGMAAAAVGASDERTQQKQQQSCSVSSPSSSSMELPLHPFPLLDE